MYPGKILLLNASVIRKELDPTHAKDDEMVRIRRNVKGAG